MTPISQAATPPRSTSRSRCSSPATPHAQAAGDARQARAPLARARLRSRRASAARAILRYFDSAAVHHHEDEEDSLMPRILARVPEARTCASRLAREHEELAEQWRPLRPLLSGIAAGQRAVLSPKMVLDVTGAYEAHLASEEAELIPLAADVLTPDELRAIGREMATRRGVTVAV
jgi:hypothetical protein